MTDNRDEWIALANRIEARVAEGQKKHGFTRAAVHYDEVPMVVSALRSAASSAAVPVAVKPLEWEQPDGPDGTAWLGHGTDMCQYYIRFDTETASYWMPGERPLTDDDDSGEEFLSIDEAKAAAQADYEQRIRSALNATPVAAGVRGDDDE